MKILVTGGAGYIGSHAVKTLVEQGHTVRVLDDLSTGHAAAVDPAAQLIEGDLRDAPLVAEALDGVDAVLHFAARSVVGDSMRQPLEYWQSNVIGSLTLLASMQRQGVRRLVFSSTAATYGIPPTLPITEDTPQLPINPYGQTKLAIERAIADLCQADPTWSATLLRYFNVAGCRDDAGLGEDHRPETHLIPIVLEAARGTRDHLSIFGTDYDTPDGTCLRDYVHVQDLVDAHVMALDAMQPGACRAYNVGLGRGYSVREVIRTACEVTGVEIPVREAVRRPGDPPTLFTDPSRLKRELGWTPNFNLRDMIASAWRWRAAFPNGYGAPA